MCMASLRDDNREHSNLMASIVSDRLPCTLMCVC